MKSNKSVISTWILILALLLIHVQALEGQAQSKEYYGMDYTKWMIFIPGNELISPFYISAKPVTNKEYILYLVWTERVFHEDYPEVLFNAIPGLKNSYNPENFISPFSDSASFKNYLDNSESYVADYIFNPEYLNYPVIGISWEQANKFCHWLSDRYNEYSLITKKYLLQDFTQINENTFSTESYIFGEYQGLVKNPLSFGSYDNPRGFGYVNYLLRPSFHIAAKFELQLCSKIELPTDSKSLYSVFDKYTTDGSAFLKSLYDNYLPERKGYIYFPFIITGEANEEPYYLSSGNNRTKLVLPKKISEWCLDSYLTKEAFTIPDIYRLFGYDTMKFRDPMSLESDYYTQKDGLGIMPIIITGENKNKEFEILRPVDVKKTNKEKDSYFVYDNATKTVMNGKGDIFTCFRVAVNAIKK